MKGIRLTSNRLIGLTNRFATYNRFLEIYNIGTSVLLLNRSFTNIGYYVTTLL